MHRLMIASRLVVLLALLLTGCSSLPFAAGTTTAPRLDGAAGMPPDALPTATALPTSTATVPPTRTQSPTQTSIPTRTVTPTITRTPTQTATFTVTPTSTITPTPTIDLPDVVVNAQAHCRYGPSKAYLHAADLYPGDQGVVWGRFAYSSWLQVKFEKLAYACWVASSVITVAGDLDLIRYTAPDLLSIGSNLYGPPSTVRAIRSGNQVTITWQRVEMTLDDDRGYFIEAWVCQDGAFLWWTVSFPDQYTITYTVRDDTTCSQASRGEIRTVEKHGYSEAVTIPWP
jgi:hypothetical protein